jgi:N-acetylmuramoyl-L-alanine amidase
VNTVFSSQTKLIWLFLIALLSAGLIPEVARCDTPAFEQASAALKRARQKDPQVRELARWEKAGTDLVKFINENRTSADAPKAMFLLGGLYETTYRKSGSQTGLKRALYFYEQLARSYVGNELADEALLALGDLRKDGQKDDVGARAAYFEIIDNYRDSNSYQKAQKKTAPPPTPTPSSIKSATEHAGQKPAPPVISPSPSPTPSPTPDLTGLEKEGNSRKIFVRENMIRRPLIVIDPGHGGEDLGAAGVEGALEKDIVLDIATYLDELLRDRLRARTVLTRSKDEFIPLAERAVIANKNEADLFISIHANASEYKTASGIETYIVDNTNDKASLKLAERENASLRFEKRGGAQHDLEFMRSDLIQNLKLDDSISLAHHLQDTLHGTLSRYYKGVNNLGVKKGPFYVLVGAHMPCVLVEVSFVDHPVEGRRLIDRKYQKLIAQALYEGVKEFFLAQ